MNKFRLATTIIAVLILGESAGLIFFAQRSQRLSERLETLKPGYEKIDKETKEIKDKYEALVKEHEAIKEDRNNLLSQTKNMLAERSRSKEIEELLEKVKADKESLEKEKAELSVQVTSLKDEIDKLQGAKMDALKDRDGIKAEYERIKEAWSVKNLQKIISGLKKKKSDLESKFKRAQKENEQLKKQKFELTKDKEGLTEELNGLKKNYADSLENGKKLERQIKEMPDKFVEVSYQNKMLLNETAEMHYNLGVFYTKNKEYRRAIAEFEKVVEINPQDAYSHFNLGYIYAQYVVDRKKAIQHFRLYVNYAKKDDKDVDWAKKYLLTWETYEGKEPMQ